MKIAILGFGVIGRGVFDVIDANGDGISEKAGERIEVKKVLDIRDLTGTKAEKAATKNFDDILNDEEIGLVVECMGGHTFAYEFTKKALEAGKSVVTSNKEVVCCYGDELMALAEKNNATYLFEASVGGGIPIIHPLKFCLGANKIQGISGILNGTTNFMLTMMNEKGASFDDALKTAQKLGYAEQDPTADVDGYDAARKIAILTSIVIKSHVALEDVSVIEGIRKIDAEDVSFASKFDSCIKLVARSVITKDGAYVYVAPHMVKNSHPLSSVNDVFNSVLVSNDMLGDAMFYGKGAGSLPTASAVVSDVIEAVASKNTKPVWKARDKSVLKDASELEMSFYVRAKASGNEIYKKLVEEFDEPVILSDENGDELAFVSKPMNKTKLSEKLKKLGITEPLSVIRVY